MILNYQVFSTLFQNQTITLIISHTKIENIRKVINDLSLWNISLLGKVTVTMPPRTLSTYLKNEIQDIIFWFLCHGKTDKIIRNTVIGIGNHEDGGLNMPHLHSHIHVLNISWVKKVLDPENKSPWKILLSDVLGNLGWIKFGIIPVGH